MTVHLAAVTRDNFRECVRLKVADDQQHFVASNVYSIAQSAIEPECVPLAIYDDDTMVGFLMYALSPEDQRWWIYRLMIDAAHQRKGYGRTAMQQVIARIRLETACDELMISYEPQNETARALYASLGFRETGEIIDGEAIARLLFDNDDYR